MLRSKEIGGTNRTTTPLDFRTGRSGRASAPARLITKEEEGQLEGGNRMKDLQTMAEGHESFHVQIQIPWVEKGKWNKAMKMRFGLVQALLVRPCMGRQTFCR